MVSSFKGYSDAPNQVVFPTGVLYHKEQPSTAADSGTGSSSSLSAGAIAGIAVGAVAGVAAVAGCTWLLLQQRQRRQRSRVKGADEAATSNGKLATGDSWGSPGSLPRCSPGSAPPDSNSGSRRLSASAASGEPIPELVHCAAAHEAALMARGAISPQGSGQWDDSMLLPPHLREWVVDSSQVHYLKRPDGKLWQIGSGASSKVYRVEYRGEVSSCWAGLQAAAAATAAEWVGSIA